MAKKIIIFYPFRLANNESGSQVRPNKIYNAFLEKGYDVFLLAGSVQERKNKLKKLKKEENIKDFTFCYSEPSTYPVHPIIDYKIYFYLKRNGVPIGLYYRDAYWKYKEYFKRKLIRKIFLKIRYKLDLFVFSRTLKIIFFQTESFANTFNIKIKKEILPPAGEIKEQKFYKQSADKKIKNCLYVGGISKRYGTDILLGALELVNKKEPVNLTVICRKEEFQKESLILKPFLYKNWVSFVHASGDKLSDFYATADFGIIPLKNDAYNPLVLPVKLFEYLTYGLPMIVTDCKEMGKFVKNNKIGIVCKDNTESLAEAILLISQKYVFFKKNAIITLKNGNLWQDRIRAIDKLLS
jgi:glycosyltransferase involved in cell wall biosynthesis